MNCPNNAKTESISSSKSNDFVDSLQCNSKPGEFDSLDDLVGLDHVKQVLREALVLPEQSPQLFEAKLRAPWNLILLFGPPGTGKSSLVDALGAESKCSVLKITCADLLSSWFGESEKLVCFTRSGFITEIETQKITNSKILFKNYKIFH